MLSPFSRFFHDCLELLLPRLCPCCGGSVQGSSSLCPGCHRSLQRLRSTRTASGSDFRTQKGLASFAAVPFVRPIDSLIHRFKYPEPGLGGLDPGPAAPLMELILEASAQAPRADWIIPVPLHRTRLRQRGFNPAATLARGLARAHGARLSTQSLLRIVDTPSQTGLGLAARQRNVRNAFLAPLGKDLVESRIWLIDDVITTGSTLESAAGALMRAGANEVIGIAIAQTPSPH